MASLRVLFAISLALVPAGVFAVPGPSMSTLSKIKLALGRDVSAFVPHQSLVKGLWAFYQAGYDYPLAGFAASDNGDLLAIGGSFIDTPAKRALSEDEAANVRDEVLQSVDFSKLIKLNYGNGGGRRVILWSAVDCPSCYRFEEWMIRTNPNATFYLVPTALNRADKALRNLVTNIWCSVDPAAAWRSWMIGRKQPTGPFKAQCDVSFDTGEAFAMAMTNTGFRLMGTPAYIVENGEVRYRWTNDQIPSDLNVYRKQITDRRLSGVRAAEMQTGFRALIK